MIPFNVVVIVSIIILIGWQHLYCRYALSTDAKIADAIVLGSRNINIKGNNCDSWCIVKTSGNLSPWKLNNQIVILELIASFKVVHKAYDLNLSIRRTCPIWKFNLYFNTLSVWLFLSLFSDKNLISWLCNYQCK